MFLNITKIKSSIIYIMLCALMNASVCTVELFGLLVSILRHCSITSSLPNKCFSVCFFSASCQEGKKTTTSRLEIQTLEIQSAHTKWDISQKTQWQSFKTANTLAVEVCYTYVWGFTLMVFYPTACCASTNDALSVGWQHERPWKGYMEKTAIAMLSTERLNKTGQFSQVA